MVHLDNIYLLQLNGIVALAEMFQVLQIFIDNPFPMTMLKLNTSLRCIDINANRQKLAVVDEHNTCLVYSIKSKELLYQVHSSVCLFLLIDFLSLFSLSAEAQPRLQSWEGRDAEDRKGCMVWVVVRSVTRHCKWCILLHCKW